jgi:hypothetical protein
MMKFENTNNKKNGSISPLTLIADLNAWAGIYDYADQEALYATSNNNGIGTNGLQVSDVTSIANVGCANPATSTNPVTGDWCYNFQKYCSTMLSNGNYPICSLQTLMLSTPGDNDSTVVNQVGSLSDEYWDSSSGWTNFTGLIPTASQYGANNLEIYTCDILYTVMYAFPTNNYPLGTNNCDTGSNQKGNPANSAYENDYENAFAAFFNGPNVANQVGIYSPTAGGPTQTDSSVTLTWNAYTGATSYTVWVGPSQGSENYYHNSNAKSPQKVNFTAQPSGTSIWVRWQPNNASAPTDYHYVTP